METQTNPLLHIDQPQGPLGIPIETRASAIYTNLGSADDQPRSVAICPNRKCVAFGCRMGIELHWVDALTGGDLNRWFPLAAPSDYLYFLPQRPGMDSRKKLRLISSAAGPVPPQLVRSDSTPAKWKYWPTPVAFGRRKSFTRLFFGNMPFPSPVGDSGSQSGSHTPSRTDEVQGILRTVDCDHFHAVPVSDGFHLIFTDPGSGLLCLGSDAPLGGPTKLIRKIMFIPPDQGQRDRWPSPLRHAVGKSLQWGLRLVVVYDNEQVVLYNVPSDIFRQLQDRKNRPDVWDEHSGVLGQSDLIMDSLMADSEADTPRRTPVDDAMGGGDGLSRQSLQLVGSVVARLDNQIVDDVAVQSENGGLSIWMFYRSGIAELHDIYAPRAHKIRRKYAGDNGLIYDRVEDGVVEDCATPRPSNGNEKTEEDVKHVKWAGQEDID